MGTPGPTRAWGDCPTCRGKDGKRWGEVDVRERCQACNGQGFTAGVLYGFDEEVRTECPRCHWQGSIIVKTIPCPTCAAHFKAVDEAVAEALKRWDDIHCESCADLDEARASGAREATERAAKVAEDHANAIGERERPERAPIGQKDCCTHGRRICAPWDDCPMCIAAAIRALTGSTARKGEGHE